MSRLDVAVVGCGHMGALHARTVAADSRCRLAAVVDVEPARAAALARRCGAEARPTVPEGVGAVIVATPTATHAHLARVHLQAGRWVLVEKPFTGTPAEAEALQHPRVAVGHVERFNPGVRAAGLLEPVFVDARRLVRWSGRSAGVDVVQDLMVHDLDLLLHWSEGGVDRIDAAGVAVRGEAVDVASVQVQTTDGIVAQFHASRVATVPERVVRVYEQGRTTLLDLLAGVARRDPGPLPGLDGRDGLTAQWDSFVAAVHGRAPVVVGARDGWRSVALAARIRRAMKRGWRAWQERAGIPLARA